MGEGFLSAYKWIGKKKWSAVIALLLFVLGLIAVSSSIRFEDDITSLIPANEETRRIQKVLQSITFTDKIIVNIEKGGSESVDDLTDYATEFLDSVQKNQKAYIKNIQGRVLEDDLPNTLNLIYDNLPLFLAPEDYTQIRDRLSKDSIFKITAQNYRTLISPSGIVTKKTMVKDPLGLSFIALKKLQQLGIGDDFKLKNGFLLDKKERNILLFITPTYGSSGTEKNVEFSEELYALQEKLNTKYEGKVKSAYFGAALVAVANATQIKHDIQFTVSIAMTVLIVLLIFFYRKISLPLILFAPTVFGVLLSITFLCLLRAKISLISLGIGSVLLGVTLDYALHILTHIRNGKTIDSLYREVASSILMSSLTTASAFLCLLFLESQALQDLGIFAAVSVIGASVFALLFIPQVYKTVKKKDTVTILDRMAGFHLHRSKWAIALLGIIALISIFTYGKVIFNKDLNKLNYETEVLANARLRLEKLTDIGSKSIYLSTYGDDTEQVLRQNDSLFEKLRLLRENERIISYSSVGGLIQSEKTQMQKINTWRRFWQPELIKQTRDNLMVSGDSFGFKPTTFKDFYALLNSDFRPLKIDDYKVVKSFALDDFIVTDENGTTITSLLKIDDAENETIRNTFKDAPNTLLIDRQQVNETFLGNLKNDFNSLLGYSLLVVLIILFIFYRRFSLTLVTSIPIFSTWFLTVGIMGLFGIEFNIFNIIICSFIFGLGVDYSIFITNALFTEYRTGESTLATHKTSIILSVITTIAGVGVMIFAKHPVLYTISLVSMIGILCAAFVSFTIQPLLFKLFIGNAEKRPISPRYFVHSIVSFGYFGIGGFLFSIYASIKLALSPKSRMRPNLGFHRMVSNLMRSVLYTNPFVTKTIINPQNETFDNPAILIANHTSFLDILAIGMLDPKIIFLVNDWVYNSPVFGSAAKLAGAYPVSMGMEKGEPYFKEKIAQGFSFIVFPEGTRATNNKIKRFHKGAFYMAEHFGLDVLPVLIHGNSEVLPKGSFSIRDGSITLEILPRITPNDQRFGKNYTERAKKVGQYFRTEFRRLRDETETETYWQKTLLEHYRYKGKGVFSSVKKDIEQHQNTYGQILKLVGAKDTIVHLSNAYGQLDLLLALDSIDRKINLYLEKDTSRKLLENNFLTQNYSKIYIYDTIERALQQVANVLLLDFDVTHIASIEKKFAKFQTVILLKDGTKLSNDLLQTLGFAISDQSDNFMVLRKNDGVT